MIGAALAVHRTLGPGLLESAYRACLLAEPEGRGLHVQCEVPLPIEYGSKRIETGYRLDLVVERRLIVELKAVLSLEPIHLAQLLTYLRLARAPLGLLINFNVLLLKDGIRRVIHTPAPP